MSVEIINVDCMDYMRDQSDQSFDLAIVDPPYFCGPNQAGYYGKEVSSLGVQRAANYQSTQHWSVPNRGYFKELTRVSKHQIIWGANHFAGLFDSSSSCWIVWDKNNGNSSFADCELAYSSFTTAARLYRYTWMGMHQGSFGGDVRKNETRIHPTQKPVALYQWLLQQYAQPDYRVLDTHLGSGSSAIAAHYFECDFVGCEIDKHYYRSALTRYLASTKQLALNLRASA